MHRNWKTTGVSVTLLCFMLCFSAFSYADGHTHVRGTIVSSNGDTLIVKDRAGVETTVVVTPDTRLKGKGVKQGYAAKAALIPGLSVKVEGDADEANRVVAKEIKVGREELETAEMMQTNLQPIQAQVAANSQQIAANSQKIDENAQKIAANSQRIDENSQKIAENAQKIDENQQKIVALNSRLEKLGERPVQASGTVNFETNKAKLSEQGKQELQNLAQKAASTPGSFIEIKGFTDSTGTVPYNDKLSVKRARAVMDYLIRELKVPRRSILAPAGMGESMPVASNDTTQGRAENRRAEINVLGGGEFAGK